MIDAKDLKTLLATLREAGVVRFKCPEFEAELGPQIDSTPSTYKEPIGAEFGHPTEEELLFLSSPYQPNFAAPEGPEEH